MNQWGIFIQIFCAVIAAAILVHLYTNGRRTRATNSYMLCILLFFLWNLAEVLLLMSQDANQEMRAIKLKFLPVVYIGVSWLYFCLAITQSKLAQSKTLLWIFILFPGICYLFLLTNEWHNLFFIDIVFKTKITRGPVFWIHTAESYFCIFAGTVYFFIYMRKKIGKSLREILWLIVAVLLPMVANFLMLSEIIPNRGLDITPQALLLTLVIFGLAVYQKKFLNLIPVAARHFVEEMTDGIIIIDHENALVGVNRAARGLLPELELNLYDPVYKLSAYIRENSDGPCRDELTKVLEQTQYSGITKGNFKIGKRNINMEIRSLSHSKHTQTGKMLILMDRTEEHLLMEEIQNKNALLMKANDGLILSNSKLTYANQRLEQFSETIEELAITRERNRVGREVHDTVGHTLTLLIALAESAKVRLTESQNEVGDIMDKSIELARQALNDIRNCLKGIFARSFESANLAEWMLHLGKVNGSSGTRIDFSLPEDLPALDATRIMTIYRICQEAITNAIRHGKAETISITMKSQDQSIRLYIFDDGKGCKIIEKGYGLTGMEERVTKLSGTISFGSDGEKGFNIIADIPL